MITMKDIARLANVSIGTVDRVIHKRGRVAKRTALRVEKIMRDMEYETNIFARNLSISKKFRFAAIMPLDYQDSGYWGLQSAGMKRAESELAGFGTEIERFGYDRFSERSFKMALAKSLECGPDGIIGAIVTSKMAGIFFAAISSDIPFVLVDSDHPNERKISYIGQDSYQSGQLSGKLMSLLLNGRGNSAVIRTAVDDYHIHQRVGGFLDFLKMNTAIECKVFNLEKTGDDEIYFRLMEKIFREVADPGGLFVTDASAHYAAAYLKKRGISLRIIGNDLIPENSECLKSGEIDFIISQRPEMQGYEGVTALHRMLVLNERIEKRIIMPLDIITRENIPEKI
jgi:LacI family transcriptional regulator